MKTQRKTARVSSPAPALRWIHLSGPAPKPIDARKTYADAARELRALLAVGAGCCMSLFNKDKRYVRRVEEPHGETETS